MTLPVTTATIISMIMATTKTAAKTGTGTTGA